MYDNEVFAPDIMHMMTFQIFFQVRSLCVHGLQPLVLVAIMSIYGLRDF